jgi:hypothetical protein
MRACFHPGNRPASRANPFSKASGEVLIMRGCAGLKFAAGLLAVLLCGFVGNRDAAAQSPSSGSNQSQQHLEISAARAQRKAIVGENMNLTPDQAKVFWPIYNAYEARMDTIEDRHIREIKDYVSSYDHLTDADANRKLDEVMAIQQARLEAQKTYLPKFRASLPGVVVTRFFQIDNKMRAMIQCNIAQMVPLAQPSRNASSGDNS